MLLSKDEIIKAEVLHEAGKLFRHFGLNKTTMEDIARAVGKGKSTLYYYYKSKEEIFDAVMKHEKDAIFKRIQDAVALQPTATAKMEAYVRVKFNEISKISVLYQAVVREVQNCNEIERNIRKGFDSVETDIVKSILQYGLVTGEFSRLKQSELDLLAFTLVSSQRGVEIAAILGNRLGELEAQIDWYMEVLFNGIKNL
jgi:AcrR family transcriptional regulator